MDADVQFFIFPIDRNNGRTDETLRFTNVPMERVKAAIDLLNGDHPSILETPIRAGIGEYTKGELFPNFEGSSWSRAVCMECGAIVGADYIHKHTTWHNKLLP